MTQFLPLDHNPETCESGRDCTHANCKAYWAGYDVGFAQTYQPSYEAGLALGRELGSQP